MRVYLIAGANGQALKQILEKRGNISVVRYERSIEEAFFYLKDNKEDIDIIFLVDQGINCSMSTFGRLLNDFKELMNESYKDTVFKYITKEPQYKNVFGQAVEDDSRFFIYFVDKIKIPTSLIVEICQFKDDNDNESKSNSNEDKESNSPDKKASNGFWGILRRKKKPDESSQKEEPRQKDVLNRTEDAISQNLNLESTVLLHENNTQNINEIPKEKTPFESTMLLGNNVDRSSKEFPGNNVDRSSKEFPGNNVNRSSKEFPGMMDQGKPVYPNFDNKPVNLSLTSTNINRFIAVTGHRGSGVTSTAANLAVEASVQGLKTIIIDFDLDYKAMNLYFSKFGEEVNLNPELYNSLIKCLIKPDSYEVNSCRINGNLLLTTLAYSIDNSDKMMQLINSKRLITLASVLKTRFNLVILDIPIDILRQYDDLLIHLDSVALCTNNSLHSVINTVCSMSKYEKSSLGILALKSKVIVTNYNERNLYDKKPLTSKVTCDILSELSGDVFSQTPECVGEIPYFPDFDQQIDSGKKLCTVNDGFKGVYVNILNGLFK
jgi:Mrp family chromosome partitioning ATPase